MGLYRKALAGEIENFTGISDPSKNRRTPKL
jgi:adenylylsulfate kinase-like enzyme